MNAPLPPIAMPSPPRDANRWLVAAGLACASVAGGSAVFGLMVWRAPGETTPVLAAVAAFFLALTLGAFLLWRRQSYAALERELAAERQRMVLADRLALLTRYANDIVLLLDETGRIVEANDRALITYGYTLDQLRALPPGSLRSPAAMENLARHLDLLRSRDGTIFDTIHRCKDGTTFPVEVSGRAVEIDGRQFILGIYRDLTQRKAYEREIERLNRLYLTLSQVNQAIVRTSTSPQEMLEAVCREMAHHGQFHLVWIGRHDEAQRRVQPVAWAGEGQQFLDGLDIYTDERAEAHGPTGTAVREGRGVVFNDLTADPRQAPWRKRVRQFGFESAGAFPIRLRGRVWGSVTIHAREAGFFRDKEVSLLQEVAGDISFALDHGESEAGRRQLETHNRQLAAIVNASDDAIVSRALDGTIISWNKGAERIYGYTEAELVGRNISLLVPPAGEDELAGINERLGRGDPIPLFETARRCKDGREVHVAVTVSTLYDADGRVIGAATVARDITARVKAEAALRESKAEIQCILGSTADGILAIDNNGKVIHANRRFAELWRIPQSLMEGHDDQELLDFVLDQLNEPEAFLKKVRLLYKSDQEGWDTLVFKDGRVFERYSSPLISGTSLVGRVWSFRDITERKRAEEALRKSHEHFRRVIEDIFKFVPEALLVFARNLNLYKQNKAFEDLVRTYAPKLHYTEPELREMLLKEIRAKASGSDSGEIRIPPKNRDEQGIRGPDHSGEGAEPAAPQVSGLS